MLRGDGVPVLVTEPQEGVSVSHRTRRRPVAVGGKTEAAGEESQATDVFVED